MQNTFFKAAAILAVAIFVAFYSHPATATLSTHTVTCNDTISSTPLISVTANHYLHASSPSSGGWTRSNITEGGTVRGYVGISGNSKCRVVTTQQLNTSSAYVHTTWVLDCQSGSSGRSMLTDNPSQTLSSCTYSQQD